MADRLHLKLYGAVQGVGFRYFAARLASRLGVTGYVRNLPDGAVEVEAAGDSATLAVFRSEMEKGPQYARVQKVETLPPGDAPLSDTFEIRR